MRNSEPTPYSDEVVLADEDTPRDQSWKDKDFRNPETIRAALIEVASYAEEATAGGRVNRRNLANQAEQHGLMMAILAKIDQRTELTEARSQHHTFVLARVEQLVDFQRERSKQHEERLEATKVEYDATKEAQEGKLKEIEQRNVQRSRVINAELLKLQKALERQRKESEEAQDLDDGARRPSYVEAQTAPNALLPLATEIVRSALQSNADLKREEREEKREEAKVARERWSNREKALLGVLVTLILTAAAAFSERLLGHPVHHSEPASPFSVEGK